MSGSVGFSPIDLYQQYASKESFYAGNALKANGEDSNLAAYFSANAAKITTPQQLLSNFKVLTVVLTAFNLQGSINDTALLEQLMTQNPSSSKSLAQRLQNAQYLVFAKALSNWSSPPFASAADRTQLLQSYATNTFEQQADTQASGLANALYFTREMPQIKSIGALQSDPHLLQVAVAATGITYDQYVQLDFNQQTSLLTSTLKPSQFQSPHYVKQLAEQYLVQQASNGGSGTPAPGSVASLFSDSSDGTDGGDAVLGILDPGANLDTSGSNGGGNVLSLFA